MLRFELRLGYRRKPDDLFRKVLSTDWGEYHHEANGCMTRLGFQDPASPRPAEQLPLSRIVSTGDDNVCAL